MASALYPSFKEGLLNKEFDMDSDTINAALVTSAYNAANTVVGDVSRVGTDVTIGSKTITNGAFNCASPTWTAVAAGSTVVGVVLWDDSHATDKLVAWIDVTDTVTNDGDITVNLNGGTSAVFTL